jgi:folate-binding protein YgfZ
MVKLSYLSVLRLSGVDAGSFLHSQVSADVLGLASGDSSFACYCEPKGRVLSLLLVYREDDDFFIILSRSLISAVSDRLKIYVMRSKVNIELLSNYSVSGLQTKDEQTPGLDSIRLIELPGNSQCLLITPSDGSAETDVPLQAEWKVSELQSGINWLNAETSGQFLPQMLGYEELGAVNYRKGCYPGQEIVARTHYLGKVKRHPRLLLCKLPNCPSRMEKVELVSDDRSFDAVVVDFEKNADGMICLLLVTRMAPDLAAQQINYLESSSEIY